MVKGLLASVEGFIFAVGITALFHGCHDANTWKGIRQIKAKEDGLRYNIKLRIMVQKSKV
jgi:hypothetical protein